MDAVIRLSQAAWSAQLCQNMMVNIGDGKILQMVNYEGGKQMEISTKDYRGFLSLDLCDGAKEEE